MGPRFRERKLTTVPPPQSHTTIWLPAYLTCVTVSALGPCVPWQAEWPYLGCPSELIKPDQSECGSLLLREERKGRQVGKTKHISVANGIFQHRMVIVPECSWGRQHDVCAQLLETVERGLAHVADALQSVSHQALQIVPDDAQSIELGQCLHMQRMLNIGEGT